MPPCSKEVRCLPEEGPDACQHQHTAPEDRRCARLYPLHKPVPTGCSRPKGSHSREERARRGHSRNTGHHKPHEGRGCTALHTDHLRATFHRDEGGGRGAWLGKRGALNAKPRDFTRWSRQGSASEDSKQGTAPEVCVLERSLVVTTREERRHRQ